MQFEAELNYVKKTLEKLHLPVTFLRPEETDHMVLDFGLREIVGEAPFRPASFFRLFRLAAPNTIYKLSDSYHCHYVFLLLPGEEHNSLLIGPYLQEPLSDERLLEIAERLNIPPRQFDALVRCYSNVPFLSEGTLFFSLLTSLGDTLWGDSTAYTVVDAGEDLTAPLLPLPDRAEPTSAQELAQNMKAMERRYASENELMNIVSHGLTHRAERMFSGLGPLTLEPRMGDPLRDTKNYCIICNTLMRKAAEQGGVHPVYLDSASSHFARAIEAARSTAAARELMHEMVSTYCRLVRKHAMTRFSPIIQRTIAMIDSDLSADLSLRALAFAQSINPSYLSALFKKETGTTLTDHVNQKRMERAIHLLRSTHLQIQSIAQHCGISDVNYFSKLFRRRTGLSPREFRATASRGT